ncbi:MAG: phosphatidylglycerophosphatase A [Spirochaetes bacterium]|nr:phosphatidylglycerophosphatase A [Spirochaetota bacterium]
MRWKEFLFTGLYTGYSPIAPGTAGTLLAALIYIIEYIIFKTDCGIVNLILVLVLIYPSIRLGDAGEKFFNTKDPCEIVLDEMVGLWISLLFLPFSWKLVLLAFIIFRIIDVIKPYPIRKTENLKGGLGIMLDDYLAGIYTNIIIRLILLITGIFDLKIL